MKNLFIVLILISSTFCANIDEAIKVYYDKNLKKALPMFEKLSKEGNIESNYYLGNMYQYGNGVKEDFKKAFAYYTIASNKDNNKRLRSIFSMALMYSKGLGVKEDNRKAFNLLKILDKKNIGFAQYMMGLMYSEGKGVEQNYDEAIKYIIKGCNNKVPMACYDAGYSYEHSDEKNRYIMAKKYYKKACDAGIEESCEAIKNMKEPESFYDKHKYTIKYTIMIILLFIVWFRVWQDKKRKKE